MQRYVPQARADRVIGVSRLLLAVFSIAALRLDRDLIPVPLAPPLTVLAVYAVYAVVLLAVPLLSRLDSLRLRIALMVVDFLVYAAVISLTRGAASPFFVFFTFSLFCGTLRFGARGTIVTAVAAAAAYLIIAVMQEAVRSDPGYLVVRLSYLAVMTLFLTHLGRYQQRTRDELVSIAAWPREVATRPDLLLEQNLRAAAALMNAPRVVAALEESDEPWIRLAELRQGEFASWTLPPGKFDEIVSPELRAATFFAREGTVMVRGERRGRTPREAALSPAFCETFELEGTLSAPVGGEAMSGRIFFAGRGDWTSDELALADIAARLFSSQIDQFSVHEQLRTGAAAQERIRVARDLHDGILQSLTGLALQIETLVQQTTDPDVRRRLCTFQEIIAADQREVRSLVSQLRPQRQSGSFVPPLGHRLRSLADRIAQQWNIEIDLTLDPPAPSLPAFIESEIYSIVNESLANAAKHAHASHVKALVAVEGEEARIVVEDDGSGFPFTGTYDLAQLDAERRGPVTLKERVASLGGDLVLESTPNGSRIEMRIDV